LPEYSQRTRLTNGGLFDCAEELEKLRVTVAQVLGYPQKSEEVEKIVRRVFKLVDKKGTMSIDREEFISSLGSLKESAGLLK